MTDITLGEVAHSIFYAPQYYALAEGYFADEGLNVELVNLNGADKVMTALVSGEIEIGLMGPEASIYVANQKSADYAVNFAQLTKRDGSFLVGREPIDNFSFSDLRGEVLGGRLGGVPEMTLEYVLKTNGVDIGVDDPAKELNVRTDIQFAAMAGSFLAGEADYTTLFEPTATSVEKEGKGYILASIGPVFRRNPLHRLQLQQQIFSRTPRNYPVIHQCHLQSPNRHAKHSLRGNRRRYNLIFPIWN